MRHRAESTIDPKLAAKAEDIRQLIAKLRYVISDEFYVPEPSEILPGALEGDSGSLKISYKLGAVQAVSEEFARKVQSLLEYLEK